MHRPSPPADRARRTALLVAVTVVLGVGLAACSGDEPGPPPRPPTASDATDDTATPLPATPPPVDRDEVVTKVPLDGTRRSPIDWRLPRADSDTTAVVQAVRYNVALETLTRDLEDPRPAAAYWGAFATDAELTAQYRYAADALPDRQRGPRRAWVRPPRQEQAETYEVDVCLDLTEVETVAADGGAAGPGPDERGRALTYTVVRAEDATDPGGLWKVSRVSGVAVAATDDPQDPQERRDCAGWIADR